MNLAKHVEQYDKNSNKYCGQNYSIKPLSYFNNGSFCETSNNSYIFCNSDYTNKIINLKIDYAEDMIIEKSYICFYPDSNNTACILRNTITDELINVIKNRKNSIDVTETSFGKVYNFEYYTFHFSVLNYGENINESLVLESTSKKNIIDFITNIS